MIRRLPVLAALLALGTLVGVSPALALDVENPQATTASKTTADYLHDLEGESAPDRLYAARLLRGLLARALRTEARASPDTIAYDDARALLVELEGRLPTACRTALRYDNAVAPCADILAMLDARSALPALRERLAEEDRKGPRRRLERAIAALEAAETTAAGGSPAASAAPEDPPVGAEAP